MVNNPQFTQNVPGTKLCSHLIWTDTSFHERKICTENTSMSNYIHYDQRKAHTQRRISLQNCYKMFWWFWYFQHKQYWAQENVNCLHSFIHSCWLDIDLTLSQRPYEIHSATPIDEILNMFKIERVHYSSAWCKGMIALLKKVRKHKHLLSTLLSSSRSPPTMQRHQASTHIR